VASVDDIEPCLAGPLAAAWNAWHRRRPVARSRLG
jgi:hypothetical protein